MSYVILTRLQPLSLNQNSCSKTETHNVMMISDQYPPLGATVGVMGVWTLGLGLLGDSESQKLTQFLIWAHRTKIFLFIWQKILPTSNYFVLFKRAKYKQN